MRALVAADASRACALIRAAFAVQEAVTDPPSGALSETVDGVRAKIAAGGGACVEAGAAMIAVVLWEDRASGLYLGRLAVDPAHRGRGLARRLIGAAEAEARLRGRDRLLLGTRLELAGNRRLFAGCGFVETRLATHPGHAAPTSVDMEKMLATA